LVRHPSSNQSLFGTTALKFQGCKTYGNFKEQHHSGGGGGCFGFEPKARAVSRCGRLALAIASCRAYSWSPSSLYCGLVSDTRSATRSSISDSVSANGCMSSSSHGSLIPSPLL